MKKFNPLIFVAVLLSFFSCQQNKKFDYSNIADEEVKPKLNLVSTPQEDEQLKKIYFPSVKLFNGQTLAIQFMCTGCFSYIKEKVSIKRIDNNYLVNCSQLGAGEEVQVLKDSLFDSSILSTLEGLAGNCKMNLLKNLNDSSSKNELSCANTYSISVNDGLHCIVVPLKDVDYHYSIIGLFVKNKIFITNLNGS